MKKFKRQADARNTNDVQNQERWVKTVSEDVCSDMLYMTEEISLFLALRFLNFVIYDLDRACFGFSFSICTCFHALQPLFICLESSIAKKFLSTLLFDRKQGNLLLDILRPLIDDRNAWAAIWCKAVVEKKGMKSFIFLLYILLFLLFFFNLTDPHLKIVTVLGKLCQPYLNYAIFVQDFPSLVL